MKHLLPGLRLYFFLTLLLGLLYPALVTLVGQTVFPREANGSLITRDGRIVGSSLIAQKFERPVFFSPRPSATDYNAVPSGGSNLGPTSADLKKQVTEREARWRAAGVTEPADLLSTSGSGLDPEISPAAAFAQASRVATARAWPVERVRTLVIEHTTKRQWGLFGEERVNVLELNLALEEPRVGSAR